MTTYTAIDGSTVTPKTRADLMKHRAFVGMDRDTEGNPIVWENSYECACGEVWDSDWSCGCDDDCPECGADHSPVGSDWLAHCESWTEDGTPDDDAYRLWLSLPEAGAGTAFGAATFAAHMADQAAITAEWEASSTTGAAEPFTPRQTATILAALRLWQITPDAWKRADHMEIATDGGTLEPLDAEEIDQLCEAIN